MTDQDKIKLDKQVEADLKELELAVTSFVTNMEKRIVITGGVGGVGGNDGGYTWVG